MCDKCHQKYTGYNWCHPCNANQFQNGFDKWTSKDREIDHFIQQTQLNANKSQGIVEWIPFDRFENVTYLSKGGFGTVYKAKWLDGFILSWDCEGKNWLRPEVEQDVCLKSFDNSTNENDFLRQEVNISCIEFSLFYFKYIKIIFFMLINILD